MSHPTWLSFKQIGLNALHIASVRHLGIWDRLMPSRSAYVLKASQGKESSLFIFLLYTVHVSAPKKKTVTTEALYTVIFVCMFTLTKNQVMLNFRRVDPFYCLFKVRHNHLTQNILEKSLNYCPFKDMFIRKNIYIPRYLKQQILKFSESVWFSVIKSTRKNET